MINWLCKLFIKDYQDTNSNEVRTRYGNLASIVGILSNLVLFGLKLFIGLITGAISIIADAINNLADMGSSIVTLIGFKLSSKPADKEHPFGHERIEYITGLIVSIMIIIIGFTLGKSSFDKILNPDPLDKSLILVTSITLGVAILIKLWQSLFNYKIGKKINSVALIATSKDSRNDVISTSGVLIGVILSNYVFNFNLDGYIGLGVSIFILISGIKLIKETTDPLIGVAPDKELVKTITDDILAYKGVYGIHDLVCHMYGQTKLFMTVHVEVDARTNILESHDLIDNIEKEMKEKYNIEISIHMDPIEMDNEELNEFQKVLLTTLKDINKNLSFHDLRMVKGYTHTNIIFDVVVPFDAKVNKEEIFDILLKTAKQINPLYELVINFDVDYS